MSLPPAIVRVSGGIFAAVLLAAPVAAQERYEVSAERALVRSQPSTTAPVLKTLSQGAEVLVLKDSSGWARVRVEGSTGYVRRALLIATTPVALTRPQPVAAITTRPQAVERPVDEGGDRSAVVRASESGRSGSLSEADLAGARAGQSKSVAVVYLTGGAASATLPGLGFLGLLFLHTKGAGDLNPSFIERTGLEGRSPQYVRRWAESYDRAATAKQKKALIVSSAIGSAIGLLLYKDVLLHGTSSRGY